MTHLRVHLNFLIGSIEVLYIYIYIYMRVHIKGVMKLGHIAYQARFEPTPFSFWVCVLTISLLRLPNMIILSKPTCLCVSLLQS